MKLLIRISMMSLMLLWTTACDEDPDDVSFVTSYPTFEIEGGSLISIVANPSFTDPGVTATEAGQPLQVTTTGSVDPTTPGLYIISYSATNSDGFAGTVTREVVVTAEDVSDIDLSGTYIRGTAVNEVTRLTSGYYRASNGSGDGNLLALNFIHTGGNNLLAPVQNSRYGRIMGTGTLTATGYSMRIEFLDPPNTGLVFNRTFVRQ